MAKNAAVVEELEVDPLFNSAHAALVFALNHSDQIYDRPMMCKMAAPALGSGKGLGGLDGSAQAGIILSVLASLGPVPEAVLIARVAPATIPCGCHNPCCSGKKQNPVFVGAVSEIVSRSVSIFAGNMSNYRLRQACTQKFFGVSAKINEIAEAAGVNRDTAGDYNKKIERHLTKVEGAAWASFEHELRERGIIL